MITVYFEISGGKYAEQAATFEQEETYINCLPALELTAKKNGFDIVTETTDY